MEARKNTQKWMQKGFKAMHLNEEMKVEYMSLKAQAEEWAHRYRELERLHYHSGNNSKSVASEDNAAPMSSHYRSSTFVRPLERDGAGAAAGSSQGGERCGGVTSSCPRLRLNTKVKLLPHRGHTRCRW